MYDINLPFSVHQGSPHTLKKGGELFAPLAWRDHDVYQI